MNILFLAFIACICIGNILMLPYVFNGSFEYVQWASIFFIIGVTCAVILVARPSKEVKVSY